MKDKLENTGGDIKDKEIKLFFRGKPLKDNDTLEQHSKINIIKIIIKIFFIFLSKILYICFEKFLNFSYKIFSLLI